MKGESMNWCSSGDRRLDDEFNKVIRFHKSKVEEVINEAGSQNKQMDAPIAFRIIVAKLDPYPDGVLDNFSTSPAATDDPSPMAEPPIAVIRRPDNFFGKGHMDVVEKVEMSSSGLSKETSEDGSTTNVAPSINNRRIHRNFLNGVTPRPTPLEILKHVKINVTIDTPRSTIKGFLKDSKYKDLNFSKQELMKVEEQLKRVLMEFYKKLHLLKSYSFLNLLAFSKIMKKYDKITKRSASKSYLKMVDSSSLGSSEEVSRLVDRVEATFIKHFSNSNRGRGMQTLRPKARRERHGITFFLGLFSGSSTALLVALVVLIHAKDIINSRGSAQYMENIIFGFIVLHMIMYAANIYYWRRYRVNYPFIFRFKQNTELGYREVLLLSAGLAMLALASVIANLDMEMDPKIETYKTWTELVPLSLVSLLLLITFFPFNIIYRSSRFFLLQCAFHCICAPLYKVTLPDFFLADQLTSQVQAIRVVEYYICYYGWGDFKQRRNNCNKSNVYNTLYFIVAVIPYWIRFLQCLRRMFEERDGMQGYNSLKYLSTIIAVVMRTAYGLWKGMGWKIMAGITSAIATIVSTYWDIVIDWGLLQRNSKNPWLRDRLLISHKNVYFAAMVLNILLRFAWLQAVLDFNVSFMHGNALIAAVACLEILRRGIWNFFRLENEHLNNVSKYRAFRSVPLPFNYNEDRRGRVGRQIRNAVC